MNEQFQKVKDKILEKWQGFTRMQKLLIGTGFASFLIFLFIFYIASTRIVYEPLFTDLEPKDAAMIKAQLDKKGVKYNIVNGGSTIEVDAKQKYSIRLDLGKDGVVPTGNTVGFEIFDSTRLNMTEFDKKIMEMRAKKGELERTVKALKQVKKAIVNITPSNNSPFLEEKTEAKASILIYLEPFEKLSEENVKSIMLIAASAVEGLETHNIEVVDNFGNVLSDRVEFGDLSDGISDKKLKLQKEREKEAERKAISVLSVLGSGNYKVRVSVDLDFDKENLSKEIYTTPTVEGEQLREGLIRSKQENIENYDGSTNNVASGIPGTDSNVPGYVGTDNSQDGSKYNKKNLVVNYEMNKIQQAFQKSLGEIKRLSVSVTLNEKAEYFKDRKFDEIEKVKFENMVKTAVGFTENRGDKINIMVLPFNNKEADLLNAEIEKEKRVRRYIYLSIAGSIILIIIFLIAYTQFKRIQERKIRERERLEVEEFIPQFEEVGNVEEMSIEDRERREKEEQIKEIARQRPEDVANLIRNWILED